MLDQIAALGWIRRNIRSFGGDPEKVMVFGHSAGANSVAALVASPKARGLFSAALMQSGGPGAETLAVAERNGRTLATDAGCSNVSDEIGCLRKLSTASIIASSGSHFQGRFGWRPVIDGHVLPAAPLDVIARGEHNRVPLIIGNTANEFSTLINDYMRRPILTEREYQSEVRATFPRWSEVLRIYPMSAYPTPVDALTSIWSDMMLVCPSQAVAAAASRSQSETVRRFVFAHTSNRADQAGYGAGHGMELGFIFHNDAFSLSPEEEDLSRTMIGYWTRFAATGNPNGGGDPDWPPYDPDANSFLSLDTPITHGAGDRAAECAFWNNGSSRAMP